MALAVASALALVSLPVAAQTQWQLGSHPVATENAHINSTQINFGGHEWVVIGNDTKDIYQGTISAGYLISGDYGNTDVSAKQPPGSVTLLLNGSAGATSVDAGNGFGSSLYRASGNLSYVAAPNEYSGSTLQGVMNDIITNDMIPDKEQGEINARTLKPISADLLGWPPNELLENDGINGVATTGQFWALSLAEWEAIADGDVRSYGTSSWWLRSPVDYDDYALAGSSGGGDNGLFDVVSSAYVVRPAFNLDLTSVLFTSDASTSSSGKSAATTTNGYQSAAQPTAARKFTFRTSSIATPTLTLNATPLTFTLADAPLLDTTPNTPAGAAQYVSGFLTKDATTDFYARYLETTSSVPVTPFDAADPDGGSPLANGTYILHIFSEEANPYLYSDFASQSVDFTFQVTDGAGTVENLTLTSNSAFGLDGGSIALGSGTFNKAWSLANGSTLTATSATFKPSSLSVHGKDNTITGDLNASGGTLNFFLPPNIAGTNTLLNVTGDADISNSTVNLVRDGSFTSFSSLASGNKINLIEAGGTLTSVGAYSTVTISAGVTFTSYAFSIAPDGNNLVATTTVTPYDPPPPPVVTPPSHLHRRPRLNRP
ncbi:hypothetical protein FACS189497_12790 [Betaproteobacteria bacterium]|nr:hypothetical protein FACS189497_12790 [Betaproteobacteria bacterium]